MKSVAARRHTGCWNTRVFRAAYDFLLLRAEVGEAPVELAKWWTDFQQLNPVEQAKKIEPAPARKRRRRPRRKKKPVTSNDE